MIVILTASAPELTAPIDPRFGRCAYLLVFDTESGGWQAYPNPAIHASGGAGSQAAQFAAAHKAQAVISGDFGPNAFQALQAAQVGMYLYGEARTANEALEKFKAGQLAQVGAPTQPGHHR